MKLYNFSECPPIQAALQEYANFGTISDLVGLMDALQALLDELERLRKVEWMHADDNIGT